MAKEPLPGRVKTRLAKEVGSTVAAWWFRHQLKKTIRNLNDPRWDIIISLSPDFFVKKSKFWPSKIKCIPQGRGDLGHKMRNILRLFFNRPVCIIGGDIPGITRLEISKAFKKLALRKFVIGPAEDGGFWLIGHQGKPPTKLFDGVRWSSPWAYLDTIETFEGQSFSCLSKLRDVDSLLDLEALKVKCNN
tara:strand:+ start:668 stop:1237 length:570 start_codon:yes stop_codon:yes gene_type:complete